MKTMFAKLYLIHVNVFYFFTTRLVYKITKTGAVVCPVTVYTCRTIKFFVTIKQNYLVETVCCVARNSLYISLNIKFHETGPYNLPFTFWIADTPSLWTNQKAVLGGQYCVASMTRRPECNGTEAIRCQVARAITHMAHIISSCSEATAVEFASSHDMTPPEASIQCLDVRLYNHPLRSVWSRMKEALDNIQKSNLVKRSLYLLTVVLHTFGKNVS